MKRVLLLLCLILSFVLAQEYEKINWQDLEGKVEAFDNPFENFTDYQLYYFRKYARLSLMLKEQPERMDDFLKGKLKEATEYLAKEKIDIPYYLNQREIYIKNRKEQVEKTNDSLDGKDVELSGFALAFESNQGSIKEFLFVPYFGACIHVPPPAANQMLYVKLKKPISVEARFEPLTIQGKISVKKSSNELFLLDGTTDIESSYIFDANEVKKYKEE